MDRRLNYSCTLENAYRAYMKATKKNIPNRISKSQFTQLFNTFVEERLSLIFEEVKEWKLPYNLGSINIVRRYKPKFRNVVESIKQKKTVWAYNDHTGGYSYQLKITKPKHWRNRRICNVTVKKATKTWLYNKIYEYADKGQIPPAITLKNGNTR